MKKELKTILSCNHCKNDNKVFCSLSEEEKRELSLTKGSSFFKKGQVIFYEGNHSNSLFCIHKGKVKISKKGHDGKDQVLRFSKKGDILGYRALLSNESYQATATALEDCEICSLSKEKYLSILHGNPKLARNTISILSKDLKSAEKHIISVTQKSALERISESLVLLIYKFGFLKDEKTIDIVLSRKEIANIAGTTTATTIRMLAKLNLEGIIELEGKRIKILRFKKLVELANIHD